MRINVELKVEGCPSSRFTVDKEPHSEADLLNYPEYVKYYYSVGLGAPVKATVTVVEGFLKKRKYEFSYSIKGNYMGNDELLSILEQFKNKSKCEHYHIAADGVQQFLFSFLSDDTAIEMFHKLENRSNIGVFHGFHNELKKPVITIEYHPV